MSKELSAAALPGRLLASGKVFRIDETGEVCFIKAVTFGPFPPGAFLGHEISDELDRIKNTLGANAIRFYEPPPIQWLVECADLGLFAFITIPWPQHIDFLSDRKVRRDIEIQVRDTTARYRNHPAVSGYFIGNEIEATMVRYLGPARVSRFLDSLIRIGREQHPEALFSYANYPTTEYLLPELQDFLAFNVYLEERQRLGRYLDRLQCLSGNLPVLISEFGVDSRNHGEQRQSEILAWHTTEVCKAGLAGTTIFSWSDLWFRGGKAVEDWDFGLTDRTGDPKPALDDVADQWRDIETPIDGAQIQWQPFFSIIICTCRGAALVGNALRSMEKLDYPNFEIIVVNDGNDEDVRDVVQPMDHVRHIGIPHGGLSQARNFGARAAKGEILVYTDDDCLVEPDWLNWLALAFDTPDQPACVGGPNIPPKARNSEEACVIAAPGGPAHVLFADRSAEHVPGCNLAVKRVAFDTIGGFNEDFRTAGDDVDFCWRLLDSGFRIGFHGAAFVWHLRRATFAAYLRQQIGYGRAEAMLKPIHPGRFGDLGGAVWDGAVYQGSMISLPRSSGVIYHGLHGYNPFQLIYPDNRTAISAAITHVVFVTLIVVLFLLGFLWKPLFLAAGFGAAATIFFTLQTAFRASLDRDFDSLSARLTVARLIFQQGLSRSYVRMMGSWRLLRPFGFVKNLFRSLRLYRFPPIGNSVVLKFWSEKGTGRDELHAAIRSLARWKRRIREDCTGRVDFEMGRGLFFRTDLITVTEYHEQKKRLTRAKLDFRLRPVLFFLGLAAVLLATRWIANSWWLPGGFLVLVFFEWILTALLQSHRVGQAARKIRLKQVGKVG